VQALWLCLLGEPLAQHLPKWLQRCWSDNACLTNLSICCALYWFPRKRRQVCFASLRTMIGATAAKSTLACQEQDMLCLILMTIHKDNKSKLKLPTPHRARATLTTLHLRLTRMQQVHLRPAQSWRALRCCCLRRLLRLWKCLWRQLLQQPWFLW